VHVLKSDVDVKEVLLSDYEPADGDRVDVTVTLKNTGQVDATGLTVILLVNEFEMAQVTSQSVPANGERDVLLNWDVDEVPGSAVTMKVRISQVDLTYSVVEPISIKEEDTGFMGTLEGLGFIYLIGIGLLLGLLLGILLMLVVRGSYKRRLEAARAVGMAEGMALASEEGADEEEAAEEEFGDEEAGGDEEEEAVEDEAGEDAPEEDEDVEPVTVQCPKCETLNVVTTSQRPVEFRCEKCNRLLRLSR
jgi:phage FluMu protein Com